MKKSPFSAKELKDYKKLLEEKRARILKDIQEQSEELLEEKDEQGDLVDQATNLLERNISLSLTEAEKEIIADIDDALERIGNKTYGVCVDTDELIPKARLKAIPEAKRTADAQEKFQKRMQHEKRRSAKLR